MKTIATLGPEGTFSDAATRLYVGARDEDHEIRYFDSIRSTLRAVGASCDRGVLPVENFSEGHVSLVIDHLVDSDLSIVGEIMLPIRFAFVSRAETVGDVDTIHVQFAAKGQCSEFLDAMDGIRIVTTESNMESLERVRSGGDANGAIVPAGAFSRGDFRLVDDDVGDFKDNQTRFVVLSPEADTQSDAARAGCKTSLVVFGDQDHPGLLEGILSPFARRNINLSSIVSRPSRRSFGVYHFFIDIEGHAADDDVAAALGDVGHAYRIKLLGSYPRAGSA
ncbi:ACT domain-containing protein [bacterium]|nr:ACT domain-containing protein [bacterium]